MSDTFDGYLLPYNVLCNYLASCIEMVKIVFLHPDLGIGGAERLVIDAALALQKNGHETSFITAHHDSDHCFPETVDGQLTVRCVGDWLPRSTFGFLYAFWAYLRMIYIALYLTLFSGNDYEVLFVDQISACIPFLRLKRNVKIIFYCHYPDQLLTDRKNLLKTLYRKILDTIEESTTKMADTILVNSKFTSKVFKDTFKTIKINPSVLYPSFDFSKFDKSVPDLPTDWFRTEKKVLYLSLNRFERKKNVALAVRALKVLLSGLAEEEQKWIYLVIAGGYDSRVSENIEYYAELVSLSEELGVKSHIIFLKSPSDDMKLALLQEADCLIYTPDREHFGIVPIEAMYMETPVIAVNSGGPVETVVEGETGFLKNQTPEAFAEAMTLFVKETSLKSKMGKACRSHVMAKFSFEKFANHLDYVVQGLVDGRKQN